MSSYSDAQELEECMDCGKRFGKCACNDKPVDPTWIEKTKATVRAIETRCAKPEVTDEMVDAVWQALKGLEGILIAQNIWSVHKDEFCRRIAQAVLDAPATGTNDSAASLGYLAAQALLEKVETHDQP